MRATNKYAALADGFTERTYADPARFLGRRAELVHAFGVPLVPGDRVLDMPCADAGIGPLLLARGFEYLGVDGSAAMVEAARRRVGERARIELGDLNTYRPDRPVAATLCFNAIYYVDDRPHFFRLVSEYTERKFVFDLNPRRYDVGAMRDELRQAGFERFAARPFFVPQKYALPRAVAGALRAAESVAPLARLLLAVRFTYVCAAYRD